MNEDRGVFTLYKDTYVLIHIKDNRAEHIYAYKSLEQLDAGTIINCRIDSQASNIGACFAAYSKNEQGFLQAEYKNGTLLPLMYKKEAYDNKKAVFTDKLSIAGEYTVVNEGTSYVKASAKVSGEERQDLIDDFKALSAGKDHGIIIRTRAFTETEGRKKAVKEYEIIIDKLKKLHETSEHLPQYSVLYRPLPAFVSDIMWILQCGAKEIVTDREDIMEKLQVSYDSLSGPVSVSDRVSLRFYHDDLLNLCNLYSFNAKISEALSRKVYLKSGAYITIDHTEALTAIDVNSSRNGKMRQKEETFLDVNREAAVEIARQLRIRNISGMIMIDFINMADDNSYRLLEETLRIEVSVDRIKCRFIDFTGLHLAELIRDRHGVALYTLLGN